MADNDNDDPLAFLADAVHVEFEFNEQLRGLMDVAKVAVGPSMPQVRANEALLAVRALLALVDRNMPVELQGQDKRIIAARMLEGQLVQLLKS